MEERTLDIKHIFYSVCKKWRLIVGWMLICAVLSAAVWAFAYFKRSTVKEVNDAQIARLSEELTQKEMAEVQRALSVAAEYETQRQSILDYMANSYMLRNRDGEVPVNNFQFYFENAMAQIRQYRYHVENGPVLSNQYRFLVEKALVPFNQYRFLVEKAMKPVVQYRFHIDNHFVSSMDNMTRDNLGDITRDLVYGLSDIEVTRRILQLADATVKEEDERLYVSVSMGDEATAVVSVNSLELTDEQKNAVQAYLQESVLKMAAEQQVKYGAFDVIFMGTKNDVVEDPVQMRIGNVNTTLALALEERSVVDQIADLLAVSNKEEFSKCFRAAADGSYLSVKVTNYDLSAEQCEVLEAFLKQQIDAIALKQSEVNGDSRITYLGRIDGMESDALQQRLDNVLAGLTLGLSDKTLINQIAAIVGITEWADIIKSIAVTSDGTYLQFTITNMELTDEQNEQIAALLQQMVASLAENQKETYGDSRITYVGSVSSINVDKQQTQLLNLSNVLAARMTDVEVIGKIAEIVGITDSKEAAKRIVPTVNGSDLNVAIIGCEVSAEQHQQIEQYLQAVMAELSVSYKDVLGECTISYLGVSVAMEKDPLQQQLNETINSISAELADACVSGEIAAILGADQNYISECLSTARNDANLVFTVRYLDVTTEQAEKIAEVLTNKIADASVKAKELYGDFVVTYSGMTMEKQLNDLGSSAYMSRLSSLNSVNNSDRAVTTGMSSDQASLFSILRDRQEGWEDETELTEAPSKKLLVLGVLLGAVIAGAWVLLKYFASGVVQSKVGFTDLELEILGVVEKKNTSKPRLGKQLDALIERIFYPKKANVDADVAISQIASRISVYAKNKELSVVCLTGSADQACADARAKLARALETNSLKTVVINDVMNDAQSINSFAACDGAVFVEALGTTAYAEVREEKKIAALCNAEIIGVVVMD